MATPSASTITVRADLFHALRKLVCDAHHGGVSQGTISDAWALLTLSWPVEDVAALDRVLSLLPKRTYQGRLRRVFELIGVVSLSAARTLRDTDLLYVRNLGKASLRAWRAALAAYDKECEAR